MKLRRYHRWLAPIFAIVFLWIAVTGLTIQFIRLTTPAKPGEEEAALIVSSAQAHEHGKVIPAAPEPAPVEPAQAAPAQVEPAQAVPPPAMTALDRERKERRDLSEFVMDLHSGKAFGPLGTWLSIVSGAVLIFLALSGLWMYVQMYRRRSHRHHDGKKLFW